MKRVLVAAVSALVMTTGVAIGQDFEIIQQTDGLLYSRVDPTQSGPLANDVVFIGDGFTAADMTKFDAAVSQCVFDTPGVCDGFLGIEPYASAACRFRFWRVQLVSNESGIDDPTRSMARDTALDCTFGNTSDPFMQITGDQQKCADAVAKAGIPNWDYIVVITNTPDSYGAWWPMDGRVVFLSSGNAWGIYLAHEMGHALASLGDEYECEICNPDDPDDGRTIPAGTTLAEPNLSTDLHAIKWADLIPGWVTANGFIPTVPEHICDCDVIGAWEGGGTYSYGVYRSQEYCAMDATMCSGGDDFCAVCTRALEIQLRKYLCLLVEGFPSNALVQHYFIQWVLPTCWVCAATSAVAGEIEHDFEMDTIVMKLLHRGPAGTLGDPLPRFLVYDDWGEQVPVRVERNPEYLDVSFTASRLRQYRIVLETNEPVNSTRALDVELYRNGAREEWPRR